MLGHGCGVPLGQGVMLGHGCGVPLGHGHGVPLVGSKLTGGIPEARTVPSLAYAGSGLPFAARTNCAFPPTAKRMATEKTNPRRMQLAPISIGLENHLPIC